MADDEQFQIDVEQAKQNLDRADLEAFTLLCVTQGGTWADPANSHKRPIENEESTRRDMAMLAIHIKNLADHSNATAEEIGEIGADLTHQLEESDDIDDLSDA